MEYEGVMYMVVFGTILGVSSGITPGPLLTIVISETLRFGPKMGIKVAIAPIISDLPIILVTGLVLHRLRDFNTIMGGIALVGAVFIIWMGIENLRVKELSISSSDKQSRALIKGVVINILNPSPYLFWVAIGIPTLLKARETGIPAAALFIFSFYFFLIGAKIAVAIAVAKSRRLVTGRIYKYTVRFLGLVLFALALVLLKEGLDLLGII